MLAAPYLNDNPYRLLGIGSAVTQAELQQAADLADNTAAIGVPPASGLMQVFGAEMLPLCAEKVQTLRVNPMERTVYRMFWPFDYQVLPTFKGTLADLLKLDTSGTEPSFHTLQLRFVVYWVEYLMKPSAHKIQDTLEAFDNLCEDNRLATFLEELLRADGEEPDHAVQIGAQAPEVILERMLVVFRRQAMQWWESDKVATVTTLVQTLSKAAFDEGIVDKILVDVVVASEQEAAGIQTLIKNNSGWTPMQLPDDIAQVKRLRLFAMALQGYVAAADHWREVTEARLLQVARAMREQANKLTGEESGYDQAAQIFVELQTLPLPEEESQQINNAYALLQTLIQARDEKIWAGITPITVEPNLRTTNGIGCTIYGNTPFAGHPDWYFVTYYIVFAFIPIFPIRRYLVSKAPVRGWYFHRSAPLTRFSKCHLGVSVALTCLFILYVIQWGQGTAVPPEAYKFVSHRPHNATPATGGATPAKPPETSQRSGE